MMLDKELLSLVAIALTFVAFYPYLRSIIFGSTRPHVFSWIIWGSTTVIVFLAQLDAGAGVGAWPIGISGGITIFVAISAYLKRADISITRIDWLFFIAAMSSLPFWYLTSDPLWAVIILTLVDVLGFGPTVRKVYHQPWSESALFFSLFAVRNTLVILALESYSLTTVLFPAAVAVACASLIMMMLLRRQASLP